MWQNGTYCGKMVQKGVFLDVLPVKWILTGSSSLTLKAQIKESLAGRVLSLSVFPFSENEIFKGYGYPPPVTDAHLAALASEHGCELISTDTDFSRFPGIKWKNPLK